MERLGLYAAFIRIKWQRAAQFRGEFLLIAFSKFVGFGAEFATIYILVNRFHSLGGWNASEVLALYALGSLSYALAACFTFHTSRAFDNMARNGEMDALLTKPVSPLLYIMAKSFSTGYFGNITISLLCLIIALSNLGTPVTLFTVGMILLALVGGALIHGAMMLITSIPAIYLVNVNFRNLFYQRFRDVADYPLTIFPGAVRFLLTFILPYAFISFYPAQAIFGKAPLYHPVLQYASPLIGLALCFIAYKYFWYAVNKYQGSGT